MSTSSGILDDLPPGLQFAPPDAQIVELYLLRRVRGHPDLFPGLIVDDDAAANTQPWKLFKRHGRPNAPQAFFFVHTNGTARPHRRCRGGGTWKSQKCEKEKPCHEMVVDGETFKWSKHNLNLHMESDGSCGWVMHEYTVAGSSLKMCSISFTGNGQKRKRIPDGCDDDDEPVTQRPRADADVSGCGTGTTTSTFDQGLGTALASSDDEIAAEMVAGMTCVVQPCWEFQAEQVQQTTNASGSGTTTSTFDQGFTTAHAPSEEEIAAEMVAEMTDAHPSWEFQAEQVQQQTMNASCAPQEIQPPSSSTTTTMTFSQESGSLAQDGAVHTSEGFQHVADVEGIAAMIAEMTDADLYSLEHVQEDQSSCAVPNLSEEDIVHWEGFGFY